MNLTNCFRLLFLAGLSLISFEINAQDSLFTKYGDLLLGKVERITFSQVFFKTAYRDSPVDIKLSEVSKLSSPEGFLLNDVLNRNWRGKLILDSIGQDQIGIETFDSLYFFNRKEIYLLAKDGKKHFKDHFRLGIDLGFARAKSENTLALSAGLSSRFRTRQWDTSLDYKDYAAVIGLQLVARTSVDYNLSYIFKREWFFNGKYSLFSSTEQSLDLRRTVSLGMGKNLIHREEKIWSITGGLVSNREKFTSIDNKFSSTELTFSNHLYGRFWEKVDLDLDWAIFPSLSQANRVRNTLDTSIKYLFLNHFNIGIHYVLNMDSDPPIESANRDFILEVKLGWTFHKR
ncbi:DUF481 domain-containing protein [uncultured Algoriphagus sp.]|uniref:DUF481 domain-containing protein n=1 Tax=uncultured Algoriphagus sp. TaxID=417365 RepID=UPI00258EAB6C|nr:DUF481 domain-containing protein [uncultured Algoriphagus sp.]